MKKKSTCLRLVLGVGLLYLSMDFIQYLWLSIPLMVAGILCIVGYIRQMRRKVED